MKNWDSQNGIILRHDVDLDVSCAFEMAQIEAEYQAFGTYLFMTTHPSYNVSMLDNRRKLREMSDMGFEIGLHFDPLVYGDVDNTVMKSQVDFEATVLSNITGKEVRSISIHNPSVHGQYPEFEGYINAYDSKIFSSEIYISDSRMIFQKDPYEFLKLSRQQLIQFLVHPMHYTDYETTYPSILAHYMLDKIDDLHEMFLVNSQYKEQIGDKQLRDYVKDYIEQGAEH